MLNAVIALLLLVFSVFGFNYKVSPSLVTPLGFGSIHVMMAKGRRGGAANTNKKLEEDAMPPPFAAPLKLTVPQNTVWVKLSRDIGDIVFSVKCDPRSTTIDDLKELVKIKCSPAFNGIAAPFFDVKGADGVVIEEDVMLIFRAEGKKKAEAFTIEFPKTGVYIFNIPI